MSAERSRFSSKFSSLGVLGCFWERVQVYKVSIRIVALDVGSVVDVRHIVINGGDLFGDTSSSAGLNNGD